MKKVMQTKLGLGGNCEGATIATLLGLELSEIPDFWEGIDKLNPEAPGAGVLYQDNINYFLRRHGYRMLNLGVTKDPTEQDINWVIDISKHLGIKHIVAGISPRGYMHSVIYENGELWHDPHPEGGGVIPCQLCLLIPIFDRHRIGDKVEPVDYRYILASGCERYTHAFVVNLDPFQLISEEGDMYWCCTVEANGYKTIQTGEPLPESVKRRMVREGLI